MACSDRGGRVFEDGEMMKAWRNGRIVMALAAALLVPLAVNDQPMKVMKF